MKKKLKEIMKSENIQAGIYKMKEHSTGGIKFKCRTLEETEQVFDKVKKNYNM